MSKLISAAVLAVAGVMAHAEVLTTSSHLPGLQLRLRHTTPALAAERALPVLFIHGASFPSALAFDFRMDGESWMDALAARGHDVYALDFPGYGLSDRYPSSSLPQGRARDVVLDVDRAVDLVLARTGAKRVALVAHSWGGSVGALYAGQHPEKVGKLVLFAAITARAESGPRAVIAPYDELTPGQRIAGMDSLRPAGEQSVLHAEVHARWGREWLASAGGAAGGVNDVSGAGVGDVSVGTQSVRFPSGPSADADALRHGEAYYDPARIKAPTLLVRGEWDAWPSDADYRQLQAHLASAASKEYVVIPRGTHVMHLESAHTALWQTVANFLEH